MENKRYFTEGIASQDENTININPFITKDNANLFKRVREIPLKSSSLSGEINSICRNDSVQFESSLERDFVYMLEFDINVNKYIEQPIEINYIDIKGKNRKYTPDFLVEYFDKNVEIIEIKYESVLLKKIDELEIKFNAAKEFCIKNQFNFRLITDKEIRIDKFDELANYKFLFRYKNFFHKIISTEQYYYNLQKDLIKLYDLIYKLQKCSIKELIDKCSNNQEEKSQFIFLTWCMLADNLIKADLTIKLNLDTIIWYN